MPLLEFGEYLPDLPPVSNPGLTKALNATPQAKGYGPCPSLQATGVAALDARVQGAVSGKDRFGNTYEIAGTASKLWYTTTGSPVDVSTSGGYTTGSSERWEIVQYGQEIFAANYADEVQNESLSDLSGAQPFDDVSTTWQIPHCRHLAVVRDFVVCGDVNDSTNTSDGQVRERVHWGPIGAPAQQWPTAGSVDAKAVQSDFQDIRGGRGGAVQQIVGASEIGLIFLEKEVWRMDYVGGTRFFDFFPVEENRGCLAPGSVASAGRWTFFLSEDGFYMTDGTQSIPIGKERLNRTVLSALDFDRLDRISAAVDPRNTRYVMAYTESTGGNPDRFVIYDWVLDKWSHAEEDLEVLTQVLPAGLNADTQLTAGTDWLAGTEGTTTTSNSLTNDLLESTAAIVTNLDAAEFFGTRWALGAYDTDHAQARFDGSPKKLTLETGDFELFPNRHAHVSGVRPVSSSSQMSVGVASKNLPSDATVFGSQAGQNSWTGTCDQRAEGRYHRARAVANAPAADDQFHGLDVDAVITGVR